MTVLHGTIGLPGSPSRSANPNLRGEESKDALSGPVRTYHISELGEAYMQQLEEQANPRHKAIDRDQVLRLIIDEELTPYRAAKQLGVHHSTILHHLQQAVKSGVIRPLGDNKYAWADNTAASETSVAPSPQQKVSDTHVPGPSVAELQRQVDILASHIGTLVSRIELLERRVTQLESMHIDRILGIIERLVDGANREVARRAS